MNNLIKQAAKAITLFTLVGFSSATIAQPKQHLPVSINNSSLSDEALVKQLPGFANGYATVNGIRIHYVKGGTGKPLVLLSGWPQTWWSFHKMMPELQKSYTVIAVDYRGMGSSAHPDSGYDKKTVSNDVYELLKQLGYEKAYVAGHDIGAQVAFSLAANHPGMVEKLVMIDVPHPDETFAAMPMLPALGTPTDKLDPARPYVWWFAFNQINGLPEELIAGRAAVFQKTIFHYLLNNDSSLSTLDRAVYAAAYNSKETIRAGNNWYRTFMQDIEDYKQYAPLNMPVLGLGGPGYGWLNYTLPKKATNVKVVKVENSGHFVPEEQPAVAVAEIKRFLN
ncbi:Pimeloyl-ACP methyl ester carboxylesterase [Filimonas lacunae]|uniref:Pimeloyl-ACP methyl ester carboxylesterase n=1 Tax=Filimonas lacunae TaxID=477680 RepID=A0A173MHM1_9BACT|nr:alpha/beta hydrolase [Filimonas lacunae]BAV06918.1 alpha/beta hydrolase fold [Filimonas lacunae]SIS97850.1 Pimeloyl-ACP methyl ester carboxylesterase [Filimonas lacunae]